MLWNFSLHSIPAFSRPKEPILLLVGLDPSIEDFAPSEKSSRLRVSLPRRGYSRFPPKKMISVSPTSQRLSAMITVPVSLPRRFRSGGSQGEFAAMMAVSVFPKKVSVARCACSSATIAAPIFFTGEHLLTTRQDFRDVNKCTKSDFR